MDLTLINKMTTYQEYWNLLLSMFDPYERVKLVCYKHEVERFTTSDTKEYTILSREVDNLVRLEQFYDTEEGLHSLVLELVLNAKKGISEEEILPQLSKKKAI